MGAALASSLSSSFPDHRAALRDPSQSWKVVYPLRDVLLPVLAGTLAGAEDFVEIRRRALLHLDILCRFLPFASGTPSQDTLSDITNVTDGELFGTCFVHDTTDGDHGRIEQRHHAFSHDVAFLDTDRRSPA